MEKKPSHFRTWFFYSCGQASYWGSLAAVSGYTVLYLSSKGIADARAGMVVSAAAILAIALQLIISDYADKHPNNLSKTPIVLLASASSMCAFAVIFIKNSPIVIVVLYTLAVAFLNAVPPFLGTVAVKSDIHIHFAIPRGIGAACYALNCLVIGFLLRTRDVNIVMMIYAPIAACLALSFHFMRECPRPNIANAEKDPSITYFSMLKSNKVLRYYIIASVFTYLGQQMCSPFLIRIVENCRGGSGELGIALFIQTISQVPMTFSIPKISKKIPMDKLVLISFFAFSARFILMSAARSTAAIYIISALNTFCIGIQCVASIQFADLISGEKEKARAQALTSFSNNFGQILGGALSTVIIPFVGARGLFAASGAVCFVGFCVMLLSSRLYNTDMHKIQ